MFGISLVIPVLNETDRVSPLIRHLRSLESESSTEVILKEIIIIDGDRNGSTIAAVSDPGIKCIVSPRGRALQMNAGAAEASGDVLLFLHADTRLPAGALELIYKTMRTMPGKKIAGGAFDLAYDSSRYSHRIIARAASLRSRLTRIPYGDQAIFIRRDIFLELGGYRDLPLMEDVELMSRLRRLRMRIEILKERVETSPRRLEQEGAVLCTLRNWILITAYALGAAPERLAPFYRFGRGGAAAERRRGD